MKSRNANLFVAVTSFCLLSTPAWLIAQQQEKLPPVHYHITDLGTLGGPVQFGLFRGAIPALSAAKLPSRMAPSTPSSGTGERSWI